MKNSKFAITVFVSILISGASFFAWAFTVSKIYEKRLAIAESKKTILENDNKIMEAKELKTLMAGIKKEKSIIDSVFLTEKDLLRVIQGLESISKNSGAELSMGSVYAKEGSANPVFNFSVTGSFGQLFEYFYFLENIPYLINVDKVSFQKTETVDKKNGVLWKVDFDVELEGYEKS